MNNLRKHWWAGTGVAFTALVSSFAYMTAIVIPLLGEFVNGFAARPFVYRWLPVFTLRLLAKIMQTNPTISFVFPFANWDGALDFPIAQAIVIQSFLSLLAFGLAVWFLIRRWSDSWAAVLLAVISPVVVLVLYARSPHPYDLPILALFTLGLALLAHGRMWAYLMVFVLACLTKETAIFLTVIYAANMAGSSLQEQPRYRTVFASDAAWWFFAQLVIYGLARVALWISFRDWLGGEIEFHLLEQLISFVTVSGIAFVYAVVGSIVLCMLWVWSSKPLWLRNSAIIVPVFFALYLLGGVPLEFRIFGEVFPIAYLLAAWPLVKGVA